MGPRAHPVAGAAGLLGLAVVLAVLFAPGCSKKLTTFVHPTADFSLIERVAVLPLENMSTDNSAAEKVRQLLIIELLSSGAVDVVDVGEVARGIRASGVGSAASPGTDEARKLGEELQVQALLAGSVQEFSRGRGSGAVSTNVSLVFRLLETDTGQVIWSSSVSQTGTGAMARLFGVGGESPGERARKLIRKALKKLIR